MLMSTIFFPSTIKMELGNLAKLKKKIEISYTVRLIIIIIIIFNLFFIYLFIFLFGFSPFFTLSLLCCPIPILSLVSLCGIQGANASPWFKEMIQERLHFPYLNVY